MKKDEMRSEAIQSAMEDLSSPAVYNQVMLASSPEAAKVIVESLPGARELLEIGPEAGGTILDFLQHENTLKNYKLSAIALWLLSRIPTPNTSQILAGLIVSGKFSGINKVLAAEVFLKSLGIEFHDDDDDDDERHVLLAFNEAQKRLKG